MDDLDFLPYYDGEPKEKTDEEIELELDTIERSWEP